MLPLITLGADFATTALAYVGTIWTDLETLILIIVGLPIAFWVVRKAISLVRAR